MSALPAYHGTIASLAREFPILGLAMTQHRSMRGDPLSFQSMPYLVELYADARKIEALVARKAVQTGVSEWNIQVLLDAAGWRGRIVAYVLPTYGIRNRFVQSRVNPLLVGVPAYRDRSPGGAFGEAKAAASGNLSAKRFGRGGILFLGSGTASDFIEFSADVLFVDEFDRCNKGNLAMAEDRLRASPYPQHFYVGNPTLPRVGVSKLYDESDRRRWFHRCSHCGERQPLDWFAHVVERDDSGRWRPRDTRAFAQGDPIRPICLRCREPFERLAEGALWVPEDPGNPMRGYHISRLDVLSDSLLDLFGEWVSAQGSPDLLRAFYTSVLGMPFEFEGTRLTTAALEAACADEPDLDYTGGERYADRVVTAGVDVGSLLHVTISVVERDEDGNPLRRARFVGTCQRFEEVEDLLDRFRVDLCVIDAAPELHKAQEIRDRYIEKGSTDVWLCRFYPTPRVDAQKYGMKLDYRSRVVQVDRTSVFDVSFYDVVEGRRRFPLDSLSVLGWAEQMKAPVRVTDTERSRIVWTEGSAPDHFRLADVYDRVAIDLLDAGGRFFTS